MRNVILCTACTLLCTTAQAKDFRVVSVTILHPDKEEKVYKLPLKTDGSHSLKTAKGVACFINTRGDEVKRTLESAVLSCFDPLATRMFFVETLLKCGQATGFRITHGPKAEAKLNDADSTVITADCE